jgi:RNA polymerase sigma factor (sigma-70 family)
MTDARPIPPAELFEHAEFLKHLARRLLKDEHLAEDVVQETLVAALEHPPRERGALRAWLARTAHNLALNRRTAAGRRERHEQAAARPERMDAQHDALERLELQRTVFEQVLALDEAKRAVLFLRYHEGLTPSDIAARLGLPVKTVKTRLARGLEELRARLERRYDGDRRALGLALATLARGPALGTTTALIGGGLAMKWMLGTAAAIVLWLTWQGSRGAPVEPQGSGALGETASLERPAGTGTRAEPPAAREAQAPAVEPRPAVYALTGTVRRREDGSALAGVSLEAQVFGPRFERLTATTDEAGRYRIERNGPVSVSTLTVAATPTTTGTQRPVGKRLAADEPLVVDLWVTGGASLSARVVDEHGRPVRGATVRAWCSERFEPSKPEDRRATSAGNGAFTLEHLGERFVLFAEVPGLACLYGLRGHLRPGVDVEGLEVVMSEATLLRGHVVDERGQPIAGAQLSDAPHMGSGNDDATQVVGVQRFWAHEVQTTTGPDGAFALGPVPSRSWNARVTHPAFLYADAPLDPELEDNRIELAAGYALRGVVLGADGRALPGAEVHVRPQPGEERRATTDAAGRFEVHALNASESGFVLVSAPWHAVLARQPLAFGPDAPGSIELRLQPETPLAGRVLDERGRPVADALVRAEGDRLLEIATDYGERTTWEWKAGCNEVRTDAEGRFRFAQLYPGEFQVRTSPPDAPELRAELRVRSGREDVELVLDRAALERVVFTGTVRDARTHEPLREFSVSPQRAEAGGGTRGNSRSFDDTQGSFRLAGYEPGRYDVRITAPGYAGWIGGLTEYREGEQRIEAELWPTCAPTFAAVDERGRALSARLVFHDLDGRQLWLDQGTWRTNTLTVDGAGDVAPGLPTSAVRVTATAGHVETVLDVDLTVPPVAPIQIVLTSDPLDVRVGFVLALLETEEAKLAESSDEELLRQAYLDGRVAPLARSAEIDFLDAAGRPAAHASLERDPAGQYRSRLSIGNTGQSSSSSFPELHLDLPLRATVAVIRAPGCVERRLALGLERDRPSRRVLALLLER